MSDHQTIRLAEVRLARAEAHHEHMMLFGMQHDAVRKRWSREAHAKRAGAA
jgi:hypothetical protein